jgi:hypothetical protein
MTVVEENVRTEKITDEEGGEKSNFFVGTPKFYDRTL